MSSFLAFDLGASSGRAILGKLGEDDKLGVLEVHRFQNGAVDISGHLQWDVSRLLEEIYEGMRRCGSDPDSIGIDTWGVDYALIDANGRTIGRPYAYRDRRTESAVDSFAEKMPLDSLYERTGIQVLSFDTLFQLYAAARDEPEALHFARCLLLMADLFNYNLTGVAACEFTLATTTHLYNPRLRGWDDEIISTLGVPRRIFQEVVEPGTILGELTHKVRSSTGLGKVHVAAVACHDTGSAVAAVPAEDDNFAYISSGTWSLMGVESMEPVINAVSSRNNLTNEGGVGHNFRVLKNIAGLWLVQECRRAWGGKYGYDELTSLAEAARPHVAVVDPDWHGFLNPPSMPDAIAYYCRRTGQKPPKSQGETIRIILESLAIAYRNTLHQLEEASGKRIDRIHIVGGGARNGLLNRFAADSTGRWVHAGPIEATAIGNLLVQAMAMGRVRDLKHIRRIVKSSTEITEYEPGETGAWDEAFEKFKKLKGMMI